MGRLRVLVVDDSVVFRTQIRLALERSPRIEVIGAANNGRIALQKLEQTSPDVMTLDLEMPEMDGREVIREMRRQGYKTKVIVFSSQTARGSEAALDALSLGADDVLIKPESAIGSSTPPDELIGQTLIPKVLQFLPSRESQVNSVSHAGHSTKRNIGSFAPGIVVIGSSTGGPQALEAVLAGLPQRLDVPILIAQHMPPVFTATLAKRISALTGRECAEGNDMEPLIANRIYVAPGDYHMTLVRSGLQTRISLNQDPPVNSVRPAVDPLFASAAKLYGSSVLSLILTGMGEDGLVGTRAIKGAGGYVAIQCKESCVVFGMPGAVFREELHDAVGDLQYLNQLLLSCLSR